MSQEQKLLPCPFCSAEVKRLVRWEGRYWVECVHEHNCPLHGKVIESEGWNTRAAQPQEVERLPGPVAYQVVTDSQRRFTRCFISASNCATDLAVNGELIKAVDPLYTKAQLNAMAAKIAELEGERDEAVCMIRSARDQRDKQTARAVELEAQLARGKEGLPERKQHPERGYDFFASGWNACLDASAPILSARDAEIERLRADKETMRRYNNEANEKNATLRAERDEAWAIVRRVEQSGALAQEPTEGLEADVCAFLAKHGGQS